MRCQCPCGCPIWSGEKSNRVICQSCENERHTDAEGRDDDGPKFRKKDSLPVNDKRRKCRVCRVPLGMTGGQLSHRPGYYVKRDHEAV